jgi:hypothetical protein
MCGKFYEGYLLLHLHWLEEEQARECVPYMLAHLFVQLRYGKAITIEESLDKDLYPIEAVDGLPEQVKETCQLLSDNRDGVKREYVDWLIGQNLDTFWKKQVVVGPVGGGRG